MTVAYQDAGLTLHHGDNRDVLPSFPDASFDSIVTDPPYELGFMGKGWDSSGIAYDVDMWRECLRVLKPGGFLLSFGGSRTWHRIAVAIEDAGFEVRDSIAWLYGSGFPKSMDVAKAIDKTGGDSPREQAARLKAAREAAGLTREDVAERVGCSAASVANWEDGRARAKGRDVEFITPGPEYRPALSDLLGYAVDERIVEGARDDRRADGTVIGLGHSGVKYAGAQSDLAASWEGWGTALKPAFEPIVVARKPLAGTVAANVLAFGTGALNIDATRIGDGEDVVTFDRAEREGHKVYAGSFGTVTGVRPSGKGRWPTNVVLDESQAQALDEQTRFFPTFRYEAKAPGSERPEVDGIAHATVKPLDLMRWLVRLVTRRGGHVLDPFAGSGTTGEAALLEGMECTLIELEAAHLPLILQRVRKPLQPSMFGDWEEEAS